MTAQKHMSGFRPSEFALRVLKLVERGGPHHRLDDGGFRLGRVTAPPALIQELVAADLVNGSDGNLTLTEPGVRLLRRFERSGRGGGKAKTENFLQQHQRRARTRSAEHGGAALINKTESPLGWLRTRKGRDGLPLINQDQFEAGERLRNDYEMAGMRPSVTRSYDVSPTAGRGRRGPTSLSMTDRQLDARRRVERAVSAVGPELSDILLRVCCYLEGMSEAEKAMGWPARSAKVVLGIALNRLDEHYRGLRG